MKQKKSIQNVELTFNCPEDWDSMTVCSNGRFCNVCKKIVYDFTDKSQKDYDAMLQQHGGQMCGRFSKQQLTPSVNFAKVAALAALSFGTTAGNTQKVDSISLHSTNQQAVDNNDMILGMFVMEPNPEFIGGMKAMYQFLGENIKYPQTCRNIEGTVYIGFVVNIDGGLTDIKVKRGLHPDIDVEAVRVVKMMSGKWKAGIQNGQPARVSFTLPIKFHLESEETVPKQDSIPPPTICAMTLPKQNADGVFLGAVEEQPEFLGGHKAILQFIKDSLHYPAIARDIDVEGTVYVGFIVETDGLLTDIQVRRGLQRDFDAEALRVVNLMQGKWKAGKQSGKPVRVAYTIPIKFRLE